MTMDKAQKIKIGVAAGVGVVIVALVIFFGVRQSGPAPTPPPAAAPASPAPVNQLPLHGMTHAVLSRSTYDVALSRAKAWQADAALSKMNMTDATSGAWDFIFTSSRHKGSGFEIITAGQTVESAKAITISGGGTALPANLISPDQAMATARTIPGYANAAITSVELIYNAPAKQWYWGVHTSGGVTLTINATP